MRSIRFYPPAHKRYIQFQVKCSLIDQNLYRLHHCSYERTWLVETYSTTHFKMIVFHLHSHEIRIRVDCL